MNHYFSFLLCFHPDKTDIYYSGRPIGCIVNGVFSFHQYPLGNGTFRDLNIDDLIKPCEFESLEELKTKVIEAISLIK